MNMKKVCYMKILNMYVMTSIISQWGNSAAIGLPNEVLKSLSLHLKLLNTSTKVCNRLGSYIF